MGRSSTILWRLPLVVAVLTALFWGVWLIFGSVPTITQIRLDPSWVYNLPLGISRWWDVLAAAVCAWLLTKWAIRDLDTTQEGTALNVTVGSIVGLIIGLLLLSKGLLGVSIGIFVGILPALLLGVLGGNSAWIPMYLSMIMTIALAQSLSIFLIGLAILTVFTGLIVALGILAVALFAGVIGGSGLGLMKLLGSRFVMRLATWVSGHKIVNGAP